MKRSLYRKILAGYFAFGSAACFFLFLITYHFAQEYDFEETIEDASEWLIKDHMRIVVMMLLVFMFLYGMVFVILILVDRMINRPLQGIVKGASEYARGNLSYVIPVSGRETEIDYLANTLNYMAEKLNEKGQYQKQYVSSISHDFRSPVTSIKGYAGALLDGTIPRELQERYLGIILSESERLEKLTKELLTLNAFDLQKQKIQTSEFDINDLILYVTSLFGGDCLKRRIDLRAGFSCKNLFVRADKEKIEKVLYNLLENAIKFSSNGSEIEIHTSEKRGKVFVSIQDYGCGIAKADLPRIWDRFFKADPSRGKDRYGVGLGLAVVKEILDAHGQTIDVVTTKGIGTQMIFTLDKAAAGK